MKALCDSTSSTLILIDLQERLIPAIHEGEAVIARAALLARAARLLEVPVIGTEQNRSGLGPNVAPIGELCDHTIGKRRFDASAEAGLPECLDPRRGELLVAGCEAHVCVLQTVLGLIGQGREVRLVVDAIGSRRPEDREAAIARAGRAGADLVTTEMVLFEWMRGSDHPAFRQVLALLKQVA